MEMLRWDQSILRVHLLEDGAVAPYRATEGAAGYDLCSPKEATIPANSKAYPVDLGLSLGIPEGYYGRIAPRSGISAKYGLSILAGVVDQDYRGPIKVLFQNLTGEDVHFKKGDRIAQIIIEKVGYPSVLVVDNLNSTLRGIGGFGSTGMGSNNTTTKAVEDDEQEHYSKIQRVL
ncbi:deoxyuridine triphosphatase [Cyprinid herpesvirus 1]|uniref:dUTP diphosphatase n=1 Tax=Cyprinid herpesvirus 1 TaxID=317858 RepID=K7PC95_9VIRU|nr:deoxyuridine triphosphatase [Cyprinid herpesvirus 1]AFJ20412.1 deoxyuridine triphosphatase [Cyprinid herpesvirus 1]